MILCPCLCASTRDRERYVQGDFRFRHGYCKHNPRKMVKTWAEKEFRNLARSVAHRLEGFVTLESDPGPGVHMQWASGP